MGVLGPWDEHNQHLAERDNERLGGDGWATRLEAETPGPRWAWAIAGMPLIHWIGDAAIAMDTWRRRRAGR